MNINIPNGFIVFISGVPGVGKTTISYELLKRNNEFRIIEETDLIREVLRGYNNFMQENFGSQIQFLLDEVKITDHTKLLSLDEAKEQCNFMKNSFEEIVARQKRKGIASIINGVHIIPEVLDGLSDNYNIIYINLFINNEQAIYNRIINRNPTSYMLNHIPFIFKTNKALCESTMKLSDEKKYIFNNIDITDLTIDETIDKIIYCITNRINNT